MDLLFKILGSLGEAYYHCVHDIGVAPTTFFGLTIVFLFIWAAYWVLTQPLRRARRARFLLDVLESTIKQGRPLEETLISLANSKDESMGMYFHLLSAWIEKGLTFSEALTKVPKYLPPQVNAMLRAGARTGDLRKVVPACRQLLSDAVPQTRSALNYLMLLTFVLGPLSMFIMTVVKVVVLPKFMEIFMGTLFEGGRGVNLIPLFTFVQATSWILFAIQWALLGVFWAGIIAYNSGPRFAALFPFVQRFQIAIPWRRKRMQRDFSTMLAILLDSGMAEMEAVNLAADCTANHIFRRRAARVAEALKRGVKLNEAVAAMDDSGELRWRLTNAIHGHGGFLRALGGWHEALDAKAFQQEQAAAHGITTALVLWSGFFIGIVVISVFSVLVAFINAGVLW
jgi:type II secretory pathway component PulF